jgi:hypothetical protein
MQRGDGRNIVIYVLNIIRYNIVNMRRVISRLADLYARFLQNFKLQTNFCRRNKTLM